MKVTKHSLLGENNSVRTEYIVSEIKIDEPEDFSPEVIMDLILNDVPENSYLAGDRLVLDFTNATLEYAITDRTDTNVRTILSCYSRKNVTR